MNGWRRWLFVVLAWCLVGFPAEAGESLGRVGLVYRGKLPFLMELERELQFSSFEVTRVEASGTEAEWVARLAKVDVDQGILITDDGEKAALFFLENGAVRVDGQYPINQQDRLARRRLWIWLGEHLRALAESQQEPPPEEKRTRVHERRRPLPVSPPAEEQRPLALRPFSLGAASMLGFGRGSAFLGSHLLVTGSVAIHERMALFANLMWPLLAVTEDSMAVARSWTFQMQVGWQIFPGPLDWWFRPYAGVGTGVQFMMLEVTQGGGTTDTRGSLLAAAQIGARFYLSDRLALLLHAETGYSQPYSGNQSDLRTDPARGVFRRVGLGLIFDR